jgi:putative acetyltransferase
MVRIRRGTAADLVDIRRVHRLAFGRMEESKLVDALRRSGGLMWDQVAEVRGKVVGQVAFSPVQIDTPTGVQPAVGLGPVAVLPDHQRRGLAGHMIGAGLEALRHQGHGIVVLLGDPAYYGRFGFEPAAEWGLRWSEPCPDGAFQAKALMPGALDALGGGVARYREEFNGL